MSTGKIDLAINLSMVLMGVVRLVLRRNVLAEWHCKSLDGWQITHLCQPTLGWVTPLFVHWWYGYAYGYIAHAWIHTYTWPHAYTCTHTQKHTRTHPLLRKGGGKGGGEFQEISTISWPRGKKQVVWPGKPEPVEYIRLNMREMFIIRYNILRGPNKSPEWLNIHVWK